MHNRSPKAPTKLLATSVGRHMMFSPASDRRRRSSGLLPVSFKYRQRVGRWTACTTAAHYASLPRSRRPRCRAPGAGSVWGLRRKFFLLIMSTKTDNDGIAMRRFSMVSWMLYSGLVGEKLKRVCRSGATTCVSGYTCTYSNPCEFSVFHPISYTLTNEDYSQCTPGSGSSSSSSASSSSKTSSSSSSSSTGTKTTTTITTTASSTSTAPSSTGTGYQIRAVEDPVFHFYLQDNGELRYG
jgi:hypothetical protein